MGTACSVPRRPQFQRQRIPLRRRGQSGLYPFSPRPLSSTYAQSVIFAAYKKACINSTIPNPKNDDNTFIAVHDFNVSPTLIPKY